MEKRRKEDGGKSGDMDMEGPEDGGQERRSRMRLDGQLQGLSSGFHLKNGPNMHFADELPSDSSGQHCEELVCERHDIRN